MGKSTKAASYGAKMKALLDNCPQWKESSVSDVSGHAIAEVTWHGDLEILVPGGGPIEVSAESVPSLIAWLRENFE